MDKKGLKIAVLSGKGGTGKTLVAVNLASVLATAIYLDCDVEEPNGRLFLKPKKVEKNSVQVQIPVVDPTCCDGCRKCVEFCRFHSLAYIKDRLMVFEPLCHSCGGCLLVCPKKCLTETGREIGIIETGFSDSVQIRSGILNIGEVSGVPLIQQLLKGVKDTDQTVVIDCPPGSGCSVMESVRDADVCILVAEPTLFGTHNLKMVYDLVRLYDKPFGVFLNKCLDEENPSEKFCVENLIPIFGRLKFDPELGKLNSTGVVLARESKEYFDFFLTVYKKIEERCVL